MDADDKQVFMTVVVVIADSDAHSVTSPGKAGLDGDVAECAIAIVLVETIPELRAGLGERGQSRAIYAEDIRPAVPVKIDDAQSARQRLHLILAALGIIAENKIQAVRRRSIHHADWTGRRCGPVIGARKGR